MLIYNILDELLTITFFTVLGGTLQLATVSNVNVLYLEM